MRDMVYSSLDASSTILVLAQVHFQTCWGEDGRRSSISTIPDNLIEDLEQELGSSSTDYLQVRLAYRHPAFPCTDLGVLSTPRVLRRGSGISSVQTWLETNITASMERRSNCSQWSPRPTSQAPNPLFRIVAAHWGPQRAANAIHEILNRDSSSSEGLDRAHQPSVSASRRNSVSTSYPDDNYSTDTAWRTVTRSEEADGISSSVSTSSAHRTGRADLTPVAVPQRNTSLQKNNTVRHPEPTRVLGRAPRPIKSSLETFKFAPFAEIENNARPRFALSPRTGDTPQPRFGDMGSSAQRLANNASDMKENRTPTSRAGSSVKGSPYADSLHDFGLRAKMRKGSSSRKSSGASRITGRWGWGGWW